LSTTVAKKPGLGREFTKFWTAVAASGMGDGMALAAAPLMASTITDDPRLIAGVTMALTLPYVVLGIPAGVLVDRLDRRRSMAVIDFARGVAVLAFTVTVMIGKTEIVTLYACFFLIGTAETYYRNASQALVPTLVATDRLIDANARLVATQNATVQFVGPLAGAALFALAPAVPFGIDALTFLVSAALLATLRPMRPSARREPVAGEKVLRGLLADMVTGARWLLRHKLLANLAVTAAMLNLVTSGALAVLVVYADRELGLNAFGFGVLLACQAVGAVLAAKVAPGVVRAIGRDWALVLVAGIQVVTNLVMWALPVPYVAGVAMMVSACGVVTWDVVVVALRQTLIPDELQGRVNSVYRLVAWGSIPVGAALAGIVANGLGPPAVYGLGAVLMVLVSVRLVRGAQRGWITKALEHPA
jgi:MFS family permease